MYSCSIFSAIGYRRPESDIALLLSTHRIFDKDQILTGTKFHLG